MRLLLRLSPLLPEKGFSGQDSDKPQSVEQYPEQAVDREQPRPSWPLAAKNVQLVTECEVL
jgi:hypothetical protein